MRAGADLFILVNEMWLAALPDFDFLCLSSYHQKYRLQGHRDLAKSIGLTPELLHKSHVAARLNGYLIGVGGLDQFDKDADRLGLNADQIQYVRDYVLENEGGGIFC